MYVPGVQKLSGERQEIEKDQRAKDDAVISKRLEVVLFNISHQELDGKDRHDKCDDHTCEQDGDLHAGIGKPEFDHFEQACTEHHRDGKEEGELRRNRTGGAQQDAAEDGCAGSGGAGDQCQHLKDADEKCGAVGEVVERPHPGRAMFIPVFHQNKQNAVEDQHDGDGHIVIENAFEQIVEQQADDRRRQAGDDYFPPERKRVAFFDLRLFGGERVQFMEIQDDDSQDGPELNDNQKHLFERGGSVELDEFIGQDHMAGAADRQPLRDALDDAQDGGL